MPSPAVSSSLPSNAASAVATTCSNRSRATLQVRSPSSAANSVEPTTSTNENRGEHAIPVTGSAGRPGDELLDRADEIRVRHRPVVRAVTLDVARPGDVLGQVAPVTDADEHVVAAVDDERRNLDEREDVTHVELEDSLELSTGDTRCRTEALDARPPLHDTRSVDDRRAEPMGVDARAPLPFERVEVRLVHVLRQPGGVVIGTANLVYPLTITSESTRSG